MVTQALDRRSAELGDSCCNKHQLIIPDLETLLAHPEFTGESITTLRRMAPNIEAHLRKMLVNPESLFCFERELEILRQLRPEMEAAIEAADHIGSSSKQMEAHLLAYNARVPLVLRVAVGEALKAWIHETLRRYVQIWGIDISDEGFRRETLKITEVAVPAEGLLFLVLVMANNDKLPRRSTAPWVHVKGDDPYLVIPFDIGICCGPNAIQAAVHKWE